MSTKDRDATKISGTKPFEIILDDLDFTFSPENMAKAEDMWNGGATKKEIADTIRPKGSRKTALDETTLLLMHLRRKNRIGMRS